MKIHYWRCIVSLLLLLNQGVATAEQAEVSASEMTANSDARSVNSESGLMQALHATMTHNPLLKSSTSALDVQQYGLSSAKAQRYPTLSTSVSNVDNGYDQATITLNQPIWAFGKIDTGIERAQQVINAEQWRLLSVQRQLIEDTAVNYANIAGIQRRAQLAQENIAVLQDYYQGINRRQKGKLSSQADTGLAYSRLLQARMQLQSINGELSIAQTELLALTQIPIATDVLVDPALVALPSDATVERLAIEKEVHVLLAQHNLQLLRLDLKLEKIAVLPTIYLSVEADLLDNTSSGDDDDVRAGLTFQSSLEGMGLVAHGRVKGASARLQAARYDLDSATNDIRRGVKSLLLNRHIQDGLIGAQKETLVAQEETMASFLRQYKSGRKSWLDVLNTQRELYLLRIQLAQSESDWLISSLRIAALIGGLDKLAGLTTEQ